MPMMDEEAKKNQDDIVNRLEVSMKVARREAENGPSPWAKSFAFGPGELAKAACDAAEKSAKKMEEKCSPDVRISEEEVIVRDDVD